jgi:hypothetical protein
MMQKEIIEAIQKGLSAEVGKVLQSELMELELLRNRIVQYESDDRDRKQELETLRALKDAADDIVDREKTLEVREATYSTNIQLLGLKETHAKAIIAMNKDVVQSVFANNRYKYSSPEIKWPRYPE